MEIQQVRDGRVIFVRLEYWSLQSMVGLVHEFFFPVKGVHIV